MARKLEERVEAYLLDVVDGTQTGTSPVNDLTDILLQMDSSSTILWDARWSVWAISP